MPNLLKVTKEEIAWQMKPVNINTGDQANTRLKEYLGDDQKYFAPMAVSGVGYVWTSNQGGWTPLSKANPQQKNKVEKTLGDLNKRIRQKLAGNEKLADAFLSLPSDIGKYVFFIDDPNDFKVIIAGWGFANSRKKIFIPENNVKKKEVKLKPKVGFAIKGEIQPLHKFFIITKSGSHKEETTGADGFFNLGEQKAGENISVMDSDTSRTFSFQVEENKEDYVFDITRLFVLKVLVLKDDAPLTQQEIKVIFKGCEFSLITDDNGCAQKSLPYFPDTTISVSVDDQNQSAECVLPEVDFEFRLKSLVVVPPPPPPVDKKAKVTVVCVDQFGNPRDNYPLYITLDGKRDSVLTSPEGKYFIGNAKAGGQLMVEDGYNAVPTVQVSLKEGENLVKIEVPLVVKQTWNHLQMISYDGLPQANRKLELKQGPKTLVLDLDNNGAADFKADEFIDGVEITAQVIAPDSKYSIIPFTTEPDERHYLIEEKWAVKSNNWHNWLNWAIMIAIYLGLAVFGIFYVHQLPFH